ncbi:hypothetical protein M430DRAFT_35308 [Amorphotheca resinae ATCC 22711]|uniref:acylphosphatase n=1 Tax=Amorphotheca resinae ATCC 22711 TaxID=857342 RepID=A0A2T3AZE9_AMORE|nr:hypothetical protein M430DRAFT_35308 [Amorphotheca resinae ATCC 22711]PSS16547.1 hypothetical protein M430DRAFT_35308 [Amorphotheca resinae ATCC 22711]
MVQRIAFRVHGRVQGVSYRYFTQKRATEYRVTGWVRNASGGKVEGQAQGSEDALQRLFRDLEKGPPLAVVEKLEKEVIEPKEGEKEFVVTR